MVKWKKRTESIIKNTSHYFKKDLENDDNDFSSDSD